ncbi:hypothetical protein HK405_009642, partial [Cladochytrium tenue]
SAAVATVSRNPRFGFLFLAGRGDLLQRLADKLADCVRFAGGEAVAVRYGSPFAIRLMAAFNAFLLWLREPRFTSSGEVEASAFGPVFCPQELESVITGSVLSSDVARWIHLVPIDTLTEELKRSVSAAHGKDSGHLERSERRISNATVILPSPSSAEPARLFTEDPDASIPAPPLVLRQPIVLLSHEEDPHRILSTIVENVDLLRSRAPPFLKVVSEMESLDSAYLDLSRRLYSNRRKRGRIEKRCSSQCNGAGVISFEYTEARLHPDVKGEMKENRAAMVSLVDWDNMDARICASMLRILTAFEWLATAQPEESVLSKGVVSKVQTIFFELNGSVDERAREYPPLAFLFRKMVDVIGTVFIKGSEEQTARVYQLVRQSLASSSPTPSPLLRIFSPSVLVGEFPSMYAEVSASIPASREAWPAYISTLRCFDVADWLDRCFPSRLELGEKMVTVVLDVISCGIDESDGKTTETNEEAVKFHREALRAVLEHPLASESIVSILSILLEQAMLSKSHGAVGEELLRRLTGEFNIAPNLAESTTLLELKLNRREALDFFVAIYKLLWSTSLRSKGGIARSEDSTQELVLTVVTALMSSRQLVSMASEIERDDVWARHPTKLCRSTASAPGLITEYLWQVVGTIIPLAPPPPYTGRVLRLLLGAANWNGLPISHSLLSDINSWLLSPQTPMQETVTFCAKILALARVAVGPLRKDRVIALSVYVRVVGLTGDLVFGERERSDLNLGIDRAVTELIDGITLDQGEFAHIIEALPESWISELASLEDSSPTNQLGFALSVVRILGGLGAGDIPPAAKDPHAVGKAGLFLGYVLDLVAGQTGTTTTESAGAGIEPPVRKAFAVPHLGKIITEAAAVAQRTTTRAPSDDGDELLLRVQQQVFSIINTTAKGGREFTALWGGVQRCIADSERPLLWMSTACRALASTEHMALVCEAAIGAYMHRHAVAGFQADAWGAVVAALTLPELEMEAFVRWCLSYALVLTLHAHTLQKLIGCRGNPDVRVAIGEQLGTWI